MAYTWDSRPHIPLVGLLLIMIVGFPALEYNGVARCAVNTVVVAGTVATLWRVHAHGAHLVLLTVLGVLALGAQYLHEFRLPAESQTAALVSAAAETAYLTGAAIAMTGYMMRDSVATVDELFAAGAAMLLMGMAWANAYWLLAYFDPNAFTIPHAGEAGRNTLFDFLYLSMTTITTTGFGDIIPKSSWARSAVMLQQLVGVMYVALVISRLAGFAGHDQRSR